MWQNNYSLSFVLGKPNRFGLCKVYLRFYSSPTYDMLLEDKVIRVEKNQFTGDIKAPITNHPHGKSLNSYFNGFRIDVEERIKNLKGEPTKNYLEGKKGSSDLIVDFIAEFVEDRREENKKKDEVTKRGKKRAKGKLSEGRLKIYEVLANKVSAFQPKATFRQISPQWLTAFENHIRTNDDVSDSTLNSNMTVFLAILGHAKKAGRVSSDQWEGYQKPDFDEDIPEFLWENEIEEYLKITKSINDPILKKSGYYFLLSCCAGYRISDLYRFTISEFVRNDIIVLRAKKNGQIVSIPVYPMLSEVLGFVQNQRIEIAEETFRKHVKLIARLAGVNSKITPHSGRHSFAILMLMKGLTLYDVAELLGDSINVARRYARIVNQVLHKKVSEAFNIQK